MTVKFNGESFQIFKLCAMNSSLAGSLKHGGSPAGAWAPVDTHAWFPPSLGVHASFPDICATSGP